MGLARLNNDVMLIFESLFASCAAQCAVSLNALSAHVCCLLLHIYAFCLLLHLSACFAKRRIRLRCSYNQRPPCVQGGSILPVYSTDGEHLFRQEPYFHYLFGVNEDDCWGALDVRNVSKRDPEQHLKLQR